MLSGWRDTGSGRRRRVALYGATLAVAAAVLALVLAAGAHVDARPALDAGAASEALSAAGRADGSPRLATDELMGRTLLAVAAVILAAQLGGAVLVRIGQPRVIGEIAAGVTLGPSLAGALAPDLTSSLFPAQVISVLHVMAQFGLIFFMFLVGVHLDLPTVGRSGGTALFVSHVSIVVPFTLGVVTALAIYPLVGAGSFAAFALFLGAAMAITAFPVLARILTDTGLDRTPLGALVITCAAIDDVTAWCILSVVVATVQSAGTLDALGTVALSLGFAAVMLGVVRPVVARLAARSWSAGRSRQPKLHAGVMVGVLVSAWITEQLGIHAIIGAFLAGVVVPRSAGLERRITARLEDITRVFLLPMFFVIIGFSTRFALLDVPRMWAVTALVVGVAVAGKLGGAALAARWCRLPWREAAALGVLMNARGLTELVILTIGLELGVISPELFAAMVIMALATTLMTAPLVVRLLRRPAPLPSSVEGADGVAEAEPATVPEPEPVGT